MSETIDASATKQFFVHMITRDILLQDCILDLIDNSLDGVNRWLATRAPEEVPLEAERYRGFAVSLQIGENAFSICDNCKGISVTMAKERVFHFGRPTAAEAAFEHSIGLYGIGMKRALFKMGKHAVVRSSTEEEAFEVVIDVAAWEAKAEWTFELDRVDRFEPGTEIRIDKLTDEARQELPTPQFLSLLQKYIARDYSFFLQKGMQISVNGPPITPYRFELKTGGDLAPVNYTFADDGVTVEILAGLAGIPPDDEGPESGVSDVDYFGWFILCNDRVILAADKSERTGWGDEGFPKWHPQYNGFMGIASFSSADPRKLPWATTKRDVDRLNPVYRRALAKMKIATQQYIDYSGARKASLAEAKALEIAATSVPLNQLPKGDQMRTPNFAAQAQYVSVCYQAKKTDVKRAGSALGSPNMPATRVGLKTFEYFLRNETGES